MKNEHLEFDVEMTKIETTVLKNEIKYIKIAINGLGLVIAGIFIFIQLQIGGLI